MIRSTTASARMGFLRHRKSIKPIGEIRRKIIEGGTVSNPALPHRLDEFRLAIPWRVAPQQSPPPLHQLCELCNIEAVGSNDGVNNKTVRLDSYVMQRIIVRLGIYVMQYGLPVHGFALGESVSAKLPSRHAPTFKTRRRFRCRSKS